MQLVTSPFSVFDARRLDLAPEEAKSATTCSACDAQLFPDEVTSTNPTLGSHCCRQGKVVLDVVKVPDPALTKLWHATSAIGNTLRKFARPLNNAFAMASQSSLAADAVLAVYRAGCQSRRQEPQRARARAGPAPRSPPSPRSLPSPRSPPKDQTTTGRLRRSRSSSQSRRSPGGAGSHCRTGRGRRRPFAKPPRRPSRRAARRCSPTGTTTRTPRKRCG